MNNNRGNNNMQNFLTSLLSLIKWESGNPIGKFVLILIMLGIGGYYTYTDFLKPANDSLYKLYTYDSYRYVEFDLMKQYEKLANDPSDMKESDILKFDFFCNSYFGSEYKNDLPADRQRKIDALCGIVGDRFLSSLDRDISTKGS
jgi:hypothetical protein